MMPSIIMPSIMMPSIMMPHYVLLRYGSIIMCRYFMLSLNVTIVVNYCNSLFGEKYILTSPPALAIQKSTQSPCYYPNIHFQSR
jgi:hypothetical protein